MWTLRRKGNEKVRGIIIIEGADAAGKTTLAKYLVEKHGARYIHLGIHKDIWTWQLAALRLAVKWSKKELVVVDRHWISEQIYGTVFRGGPAFDARCFDRVWMRYAALTILCVPKDGKKHEAHFQSMRKARPEKFKSMKEVARYYRQLAYGNPKFKNAYGDRATYVDQLIRSSRIRNRRDFLLYDWNAWFGGPDGFMEHIALPTLKHLQFSVGDSEDHNLIGNFHEARYLFVGEALSPKAGTPWPFVWKSTDLSAASWLNNTLRELDFDETRGLWTNALPDDRWLRFILLHMPFLKVVAFGRKALERVEDWPGDVRYLNHPQWYRRFHHKQPGLFTKHLREALR